MVTMVGPAVACCYGEDCSQITGTDIIDIVPTYHDVKDNRSRKALEFKLLLSSGPGQVKVR